MTLSEYEQKRLENIRRNQEMLMSLSIPTLVETTMPAKPAPRPKRKAASRAKKEFEKEPKMRRRSLRNKGLAPDGETEVHKAQIERLEQVYSAPTRDAGPLAWADTVVEKYHDLEDEEEKKHFDCIADATTSWVSGRKAAQEAKYGSGEGKTSKSASVKEEKTKSGTRGRKKVKQEGEGEGDIDLEERCVWSSDHIRSLVVGTSSVKCTKERITSMAYHPSSTAETSLVAVGDKKGGLGLFRHSTETDLDHWNEEEDCIKLRPNRQGITDLRFDAYNVNHLYLSSYDRSIRCLDLETQQFDDVWCNDQDLTTMALGRKDNSTFLLGADNKGYVSLVDPRADDEPQWTYQVHEKKIGCIDIYPSASRLDAPTHTSLFSSSPVFTTASNDRTCKVWDLRKVKNTTGYLYSFDHGKSCSAAYFAPNGSMIATTSYDDYVRILSFGRNALQAAAAGGNTKAKAASQEEGATATRLVVHNNQTGRWVTNFRARWAPSSDAIVIGNMKRFLDVYSVYPHAQQPKAKKTDSKSRKSSRSGSVEVEPATKIMTLKTGLFSDNISAIGAVNCFHPSANQVASGTSSGYVHLWKMGKTKKE